MRMGAQYMELNYETLLRDNSGFDKVPPFLGVPDKGADNTADSSSASSSADSKSGSQKSSSPVRLHPKTCAEKVSNWDEVTRVLRKKGKQRYVDMCNSGNQNVVSTARRRRQRGR